MLKMRDEGKETCDNNVGISGKSIMLVKLLQVEELIVFFVVFFHLLNICE